MGALSGIGRIAGKLLRAGDSLVEKGIGKSVSAIAKDATQGLDSEMIAGAKKMARSFDNGIRSEAPGKMVNSIGSKMKSVGGKVANTVVGDVTSKAYRSGVGVGDKIPGLGRFEGNFHIPREIGVHVRAATNMVKPVANIMFKRAEEGKGGILGFKMKGAGMAIMAGAGTVMGAGKAVGDWNNSRRGQGSPASTSPTPTYQKAYEQNAGATGDLALGLHKLRRG